MNFIPPLPVRNDMFSKDLSFYVDSVKCRSGGLEATTGWRETQGDDLTLVPCPFSAIIAEKGIAYAVHWALGIALLGIVDLAVNAAVLLLQISRVIGCGVVCGGDRNGWAL